MEIVIQDKSPEAKAHRIILKSLLDGSEIEHFDDGISMKSGTPNLRRKRLDAALKMKRKINGEPTRIHRIISYQPAAVPVPGQLGKEDFALNTWDEDLHEAGAAGRAAKLGIAEEQSAGNMKKRQAQAKADANAQAIAEAAAGAALQTIIQTQAQALASQQQASAPVVPDDEGDDAAETPDKPDTDAAEAVEADSADDVPSDKKKPKGNKR